MITISDCKNNGNLYKVYNEEKEIYILVGVPAKTSLSLQNSSDPIVVGTIFQQQVRTIYKSSQEKFSVTYYLDDNYYKRVDLWDFVFNKLQGQKNYVFVPTFTFDIELYENYETGVFISIKYNAWLLAKLVKRLFIFNHKTHEIRQIYDVFYEQNEETGEKYLVLYLDDGFTGEIDINDNILSTAFLTKLDTPKIQLSIKKYNFISATLSFKEITVAETNKILPVPSKED